MWFYQLLRLGTGGLEVNKPSFYHLWYSGTCELTRARFSNIAWYVYVFLPDMSVYYHLTVCVIITFHSLWTIFAYYSVTEVILLAVWLNVSPLGSVTVCCHGANQWKQSHNNIKNHLKILKTMDFSVRKEQIKNNPFFLSFPKSTNKPCNHWDYRAYFGTPWGIRIPDLLVRRYNFCLSQFLMACNNRWYYYIFSFWPFIAFGAQRRLWMSLCAKCALNYYLVIVNNLVASYIGLRVIKY